VKIYVAGKMRGLPRYNFPEFDKVATALRAEGHTVLSPADIDRQMGFDPSTLPDDHDWSKLPACLDIKEVIKRDIDAILECDAIFMLPGWRCSVGAQAELAVALWAGLQILN
jgi:hypothetical protein